MNADPQARPHQLVLRADPGPLRFLDRSRPRADRLPARRQRQRQVHHHEGDPRPAETALRRSHPRRRADHRPADAEDHPARARLGAGGAAPVRRHDGARECADGRLHARRQGRDRAGLRAHDDAVPASRRTHQPGGRHAFRRRAADGRDGARPDGAPARHRDGRADHGPLAAVRRPRARTDPDRKPAGHHDLHGGAERASGVADCRLWLRAADRTHRAVRPGARPACTIRASATPIWAGRPHELKHRFRSGARSPNSRRASSATSSCWSCRPPRTGWSRARIPNMDRCSTSR